MPQLFYGGLIAVLAACSVVLLLPTVSDLVSLLRGLGRQRPAGGSVAERDLPLFLFLVLAHDEELLLPTCVRSLLAQAYPRDRIRVVVVADNCSDGTAEAARRAGAVAWERHEPEVRGKPHAIAWALQHIDLEEIDAVVIIDADTQVSESFAAALAARAPLRDRVLQPFIGVQNPDESALTRMAAVYETAVHGLAYRVKERAGLNVPLGVGMSIGADVLAAEPWSAFSIAEDYELYAIFTARGVRIEPVREARITAQEARSLGQSASQRDRWMAGKLDVLRRYAGRLLLSPSIGAAQRLDALGELTSFGPVVHLGVVFVGATVALWAVPAPWDTVLAVALVLSLSRTGLYSMLAIFRNPRPGAAVAAFLYLPVYAAWRLLLASRSIFRARNREWIRTTRHGAQ